MSVNSPSTIPSTLHRLENRWVDEVHFSWPRCVDGFHWVQESGRWMLRPASSRFEGVQPLSLTEPSLLFEALADCGMDTASIVRFTHVYGPLGLEDNDQTREAWGER